MEAEKEKIVIGVRRYSLVFQDHIVYFAVDRIMLRIFFCPLCRAVHYSWKTKCIQL